MNARRAKPPREVWVTIYNRPLLSGSRAGVVFTDRHKAWFDPTWYTLHRYVLADPKPAPKRRRKTR